MEKMPSDFPLNSPRATMTTLTRLLVLSCIHKVALKLKLYANWNNTYATAQAPNIYYVDALPIAKNPCYVVHKNKTLEGKVKYEDLVFKQMEQHTRKTTKTQTLWFSLHHEVHNKTRPWE